MLNSNRPNCPLNLDQDVPRITQLMLAVSEIQHSLFNTNIEVQQKQDATPVTIADQQSSDLICHELSQQWHWPILSEESQHPAWQERRQWQTYWLVDPLDGTREFISGRPEFTINIALICEGWPVFGFIWSAQTAQGWWGVPGRGAFSIHANHPSTPLAVQPIPDALNDWVLLSSHHANIRQSMRFKPFQACHLKYLGSSLKFCQIASGQAHLYWRTGPTGEWDTAAGQAIVEAAGGLVVDLETHQALRYNQKESLINPSFVVASALDSRWQDVLKP